MTPKQAQEAANNNLISTAIIFRCTLDWQIILLDDEYGTIYPYSPDRLTADDGKSAFNFATIDEAFKWLQNLGQKRNIKASIDAMN